MLNNKIFLSFDMDGNFLCQQEGSARVYAGSVATVEYVVTFSDNLLSNDLVYISFLRPDNMTTSPYLCERIADNRFRLVSTGEELDVELESINDMTIKVIIRNRDPITNTTKIKTQSSVQIPVYPGAQFIPGVIDNSLITNLEEHLSSIERNSLKKYRIDEIETDLIDFEIDGIKEAPALFIGFEHETSAYDFNKKAMTKRSNLGDLLVLCEHDADERLLQYEYLFSGNFVYGRILVFKEGQLREDESTEFINLADANNTLKERIALKSDLDESVLKYDVSKTIPDHVKYDKNGFKTAGVQFYNEKFVMPIDKSTNSERQGAVLVVNTRPHETELYWVYQDEMFSYDGGIATRTITINAVQEAIGQYTVINVGEWKIVNQDYISEISNRLDTNTENLSKELQRKTTELDSKIDSESSELDGKIDAETNRLDNKIDTAVSDLNKKTTQNRNDIEKIQDFINSGSTDLGEYPSAEKLPTDEELNAFVQETVAREPKEGDRLTFVLSKPKETDVIYLIKFSQATNSWTKTALPMLEKATNNNHGLLIGTNSSEKIEELKGGSRKVVTNIEMGEIREISHLNEQNNIESIFDQANRNSQNIGLNSAAISENERAIGEEVKRATSAEEAISNDLTAEINRVEAEDKGLIQSEIERATAEEEKIDSSLKAEVQRATAEEQKTAEGLQNEIKRATQEETALKESKLDKVLINENYIKNLSFALNGDTNEITANYKNPVTGDEKSVKMTVIGAASSSSTGLMTADMVTALEGALKNIETIRYIGRQIAVFNTYAEAQRFDWSTIDNIKINDYFIVQEDESREVLAEQGQTTRYNCVDDSKPITIDSFQFYSIVNTIQIQLATETLLGGVLSTNVNGYVYVEPNGAMKLVGYDSIISNIDSLLTGLSTETERAQAAEESIDSKKADRNELPQKLSDLTDDLNVITQATQKTKTSQLVNDGDGVQVQGAADPYAKISQIPTNNNQLVNGAGFATQAEVDKVAESVGKATLTIQKEGTSVGTFSANATKDSTINIKETDPTVPAHVKAITQNNINDWNDKIDSSSLNSALSNYATNSSVDTKVANVKKEILTGDSSGTLNKAYDTLLEVDKWIETHGEQTAQIVEELAGKATIEQVNAKYTKPSGGIPASDLAGGIPTSKITGLGTLATKSAITSADITDGAIVNADIASNAGIAKSKLATDVQTSLGKADAAAPQSQLDTVSSKVNAIGNKTWVTGIKAGKYFDSTRYPIRVVGGNYQETAKELAASLGADIMIGNGLKVSDNQDGIPRLEVINKLLASQVYVFDTLSQEGIIRCENGLQICWGLTLNTGDKSVNYPRPFLDKYSNVAFIQRATPINNRGTDWDKAQISSMNDDGTGFTYADSASQCQIHWLAIGTWRAIPDYVPKTDSKGEIWQ